MRFILPIGAFVEFLWGTLFGVRPAVIDTRSLLEMTETEKRAPWGSVMEVSAKVYRRPVQKVTDRESGASYMYSKTKLQVLGVIERRDARQGESAEWQETEIVKERRQLANGVWVNPKDVVVLSYNIHGERNADV